MATKNNPKNKGSSGGKKMYDGKEIEPIKYVGLYAGDGIYMSAKYAKTNNIVMGTDKKPIKWKDIKIIEE